MLPWLAGAGRRRPVLNLFAYTGLATLALARRRCGASPTSTRRARPSPGPAATPSSPASPTARPLDRRRRAGLRRRAKPGAGAATTGSPRPAVVRPRVDGRRLAIETTCRTCSAACRGVLEPGRVRAPDRAHAGLRRRPARRAARRDGLGRRAAAVEAGDLGARTADGRRLGARGRSPGSPARGMMAR